METSSICKNGMMKLIYFLLLFNNFGKPVHAVKLVVVVLTQDNAHHISLAEELEKNVLTQAVQHGIEKPQFYFTHRDFAEVKGAWTYLPLILRLGEAKPLDITWIFFCEENTQIHLQKLHFLLKQYDVKKEVWIGHALEDTEPTIIHHFNNAEDFKYPHLGVGFALSGPLVNNLAKAIRQHGATQVNFSIDPSYELAQFILASNSSRHLTHTRNLCTKELESCATLILPHKPCDVPVPVESIHFAVKTCHKFHEDRIPIVKRTWAPTVQQQIAYYSDLKDPTIPTVDLGVPNTPSGHCGKTTAIIRHVAKYKNLKWLIIADDDTLLSVPRLQSFLSCYSASEPIAIGERYGYNVNTNRGYNYITGGGGIVLSMPAVQTLARKCHCPDNSTPDDMFLGLCIAGLNISLIHSSLFHQARPMDYAVGLFAISHPISFHKFWNIDPIAIFQEWLSASESPHHSEL